MRHSVRRGRERYFEDFTSADLKNIVKLIQTKWCRIAVRKLEGQSVVNYAVHYQNQWLYVGYDTAKRRVRTLLPMNEATREEIYQRMLIREQGWSSKNFMWRNREERELLRRRTERALM